MFTVISGSSSLACVLKCRFDYTGMMRPTDQEMIVFEKIIDYDFQGGASLGSPESHQGVVCVCVLNFMVRRQRVTWIYKSLLCFSGKSGVKLR